MDFFRLKRRPTYMAKSSNLLKDIFPLKRRYFSMLFCSPYLCTFACKLRFHLSPKGLLIRPHYRHRAVHLFLPTSLSIRSSFVADFFLCSFSTWRSYTENAYHLIIVIKLFVACKRRMHIASLSSSSRYLFPLINGGFFLCQ